MRDFFGQMDPWKRDDGALHLYVLPDDEAIDRVAATQRLLAGMDELPPMPAPYLHATVQRLAQFDDELTQVELSRLGDALTAALRDVPTFELEFGDPRVEESAVVCHAEANEGWDRLLAAVVTGLGDALPGELPEPPRGPHVSLAYAKGDVSDDEVTARLAEAPRVGTLRVDAVHLVSVTVRPEVGIFDFTHLASWDLA
ncbi:2'-5' RNA ligase family protein [Tessaracoccus sp. OS52]|uniref:2'-5' RNA ligase family protein n=1 Tax=Tessaracoccus sp. OS52 TaxID=2886691 RepID=UPI001D12E524|nr:2'-5' RNA ligase family protein [Tessaracoccus sp. OS52]MCC2592415.1 2'-5' RNA ligase family protein [Tessaracoccus sp. OS52]